MEILTGNELTSGGTVYLDPHNRWVEDLQAARLFSKDEAAARDALLAATKTAGRIISVEIEEVGQADGIIVPRRLRERIRSAGPTAPLTLHGKIFARQPMGEGVHVSL